MESGIRKIFNKNGISTKAKIGACIIAIIPKINTILTWNKLAIPSASDKNIHEIPIHWP